MGNLGKPLALLLTLILAASCLSLLAVKPANAQTILQPSVPEFTIKIVDRSYTVPENYTYTTNPYTGEQMKTGHGEYRVDNETIELTIKNQNLASYKDPIKQTPYLLCYNISWKGNYSDSWQYYQYYLDSYSQPSEGVFGYGLLASESDHTTVLFGFGTDRESTQDMQNLGELQANSKVDFRVQALFGYYTSAMVSWVPGFRPSYDWIFTGVSSNWSNTLTIAINYNLNSTGSTPTPSPTPPNWGGQICSLPIIGIVAVIVAVAAVSLIYFKRVRKNKLTE